MGVSKKKKLVNSAFLGTKPKKKKKLVLVIVVFVIFVVGIVGGVMYKRNLDQGKDKIQVDSQIEKAKVVDGIVSDAEKLVLVGNSNDAIALYDSALSKYQDKDQQYSLMLAKAAIYFNQLDFENALLYAKQALVIEENENSLQFIAQIYEKIGNKTEAIANYGKAIKLISADSPMGGYYGRYYQTKIDELGGVNG